MNGTLDLVTAKRVLGNAKSLLVSVAGLELLDADGKSFASRVLDINSRTAQSSLTTPEFAMPSATWWRPMPTPAIPP
jgi:hypothetical protein